MFLRLGTDRGAARFDADTVNLLADVDVVNLVVDVVNFVSPGYAFRVSHRTHPAPGKRKGKRASRLSFAKPAGRFHHRDLRRALLLGAAQLLERKGPLGVGLRATARLAGVSQTAPYRHFADKDALLAALAAQGLADLAERMAAAARRHRDPAAALAAIGEAYIERAAERPHLFRLMFGPQVADKNRCPDVQEAGMRARQVLTDVIAAAQQAGEMRRGDLADLAFFHWATVHGAALLLVDGRLADRAAAGGPAAIARALAEHVRLGTAPR